MPPLEIDCKSVKEKLDTNHSFLLLDCREQNEYDHVHIDESRLLPMSEIQERVGELDEHRAEEIVVYCHHGMRSLQVTTWLAQNGFTNVKSMQGGIDAWSCEIDETKPRY
ncbi:rhodanese-like domain-containing protein [Gimesia panareensis]|uniref:Putative adenylyltransferase/sulfurtransferase MoeZ n=1 Tax=Gimesia panareensis TaxID=2527978 RepID=A0A518ACA7_9PLAN|nr:rhodanese-like domain-containing protein [Gimesia panareensis]QDT29310.1 putative adenylyltransferase/sulfurtransferase MoeZ [Gimesia panareensis]QDU52346.1 putative adenylyltransferase/sulfurtransferase MoeZ [Gimesia panareensis]